MVSQGVADPKREKEGSRTWIWGDEMETEERVPSIDGRALQHDLETLGRIGAGPDGGVSRIAFTKADLDGRAWIENRMRQAGMTVRNDPAGNTIGTYAGREPHLRPMALGSHTDTVPNGGKYDGAVGVVASIACIRALMGADVRLRHDIEVINFACEEASMAGGTLGSQAMTGQFDLTRLDLPAWDGRPVREHLKAAGLDPDSISRAARPEGSLAAYLELHVEQGGVLDALEIPIGVVEGIVAIRRYAVTFHGHANHAGTTPMDRRKDALVMAASFILAVRDVAVARGIVGTVGTIHIRPGAANVIPGLADLSLEIRGLDASQLDNAEEDLADLARKGRAAFHCFSRKEAARSDPRLLEAFTEACAELGVPYRRMSSGAGHDAMCMACIAPQAMLFVPSHKGISHAPDEFTDPQSCTLGAQVLLAALLKLDRRL
jgi:N-carbamoyl-L-amino-acid hydrolase